MKNTTKKKLIKALSSGLKITAVGVVGLAFIGCPSEQEEQIPVQRSENITIATGKTVTVNFMALLNATPVWWSKLSSKLQFFAGDFPEGSYTLTVTLDGTNGFVAGTAGTKTATVGESWLSGATDSDMNTSLANMLATWISMEKDQNRVRFDDGMSAFELAQVLMNNDII